MNVLLGLILSDEFGLDARSEQRRRIGGRPDILVFVKGLKVGIEGSYSASDALGDAKEKVRKGIADIALALHYVPHFDMNASEIELKQELIESSFKVRIIVNKDNENALVSKLGIDTTRTVGEWFETNIQGIKRVLEEIFQFYVREEDFEATIQQVEDSINDFVSALNETDANRTVAKRLYNILYRLNGLSFANYEEIAELLYAQAALATFLSIVFFQSVRTHHGLRSIESFIREAGVRGGLSQAFEEIRVGVDYKPIYTLSQEIIDELPDSLSDRLKELLRVANQASSNRTFLRRDFFGRIYHKIVGDWATRKGLATYYTTVPASFILAYLSVFTKTGLFRDPDFSSINVCDFACGSGTLLSAAYSAILDRYVLEKDDVDIASFHKETLEKHIWGFDALRYAVQMASLILTLHNPDVGLSNLNTKAIPLGTTKTETEESKGVGEVILGSLTLLNSPLNSLLPLMPGETLPAHDASIVSDSASPLDHMPKKFDLIIMNPPFTRATGRSGRSNPGLFGFIIDKTARKRILDEYNEFRKTVRNSLRLKYGHFNRWSVDELEDIGQAGEGLLFLYLSNAWVADNGKIAFVLPKSLLTGITWYLARAMLFSEFDLEYIIISYDSENGYNFSESTSLSETLIVCKKGHGDGNVGCKFVLLEKKPRTSLGAISLAQSVMAITEESGTINSTEFGAEIFVADRSELKDNMDNWGRLCAFPLPELNAYVLMVLKGKLSANVSVPIARLSEIATIGIDRHGFYQNFAVTENAKQSFPALYGGEEGNRLTIFIEPNARVIARSKHGRDVFNSFSSNLIVPERFRVDTAHVTAMFVTERIITNMFYSVKFRGVHNDRRAKALALWLNTTWGLLTIFSNREETEGGWIGLKMTHWKLMPILDITQLSEKVLQNLEEMFDRYSSRDFHRLPMQFQISSEREEFDSEFLVALGLSPIDMKQHYEDIATSLNVWLGGRNHADLTARNA